MTNKAFIKIFFATVFIIAVIYVLFISFVNPQQTAPIKISSKYDQFHDNFLLRKAQLLENKDFETLILGSSTSEAFGAHEVNHYFNTTSFHGSIGGGNTIARYVLFKKAVKDLPHLKRIFYVADFYEFNQTKVPEILAFNDYLSMEVDNKKLLPPKYDYLKYLFSHSLVESAFTVLKRKKKGYTSPLLPDGSTTTSMIMSTVQTEEGFNSTISAANKPKLMEEILENNVTYSNNVLANFKELDPRVKGLYHALIKEAQSKNIQVIFVMSPYHYEFKKMLFQNQDIKNRYAEWIEFFNSIKTEANAFVYSPLESVIATNPESGVWRDGIHFNTYSASYLLKTISEIKK